MGRCRGRHCEGRRPEAIHERRNRHPGKRPALIRDRFKPQRLLRSRLALRLAGMTVAAALLCGAVAFSSGASASERRHGLSAFGDLKYSADFKHFDYVNPDAPKGGRLATMPTSSINTFNEFNGFILRGDPAEGFDLLFDALMVRAQDEPDAVYGLLAESAEVADDKMSVTFYLRPEARFRDGTAVTAADVASTFDTLKTKGHPRYQLALRDVVGATVINPQTVKYDFQGENVRDLPALVATLPVFSKAYYTANDFLKESLDPPLGSGPYEIGDFRQGTNITYKRRKDYWAADLPVNRGRYNFDEIRFEYYRDRAVGLEAFKAKAYDLREEFTSKSWATEYDIPRCALRPDREADVAGWPAVRRAGHVHQYAPGQIRRPARAESARLRLRFRMDEQVSIFRRLYPHGELFREFRHEGARRARPGRDCAVGALPRPAAARSFRRALHAARDERLGPLPPQHAHCIAASR